MEYVFMLYIMVGFILMWADRDEKKQENVEKSNIIYVNFPRKKKAI